MKTSVFSRVRSTSENLNAFKHEMKMFMAFTEKEYLKKSSFYFIVYTPMCAYDVVIYFIKDNMSVTGSTFSA